VSPALAVAARRESRLLRPQPAGRSLGGPFASAHPTPAPHGAAVALAERLRLASSAQLRLDEPGAVRPRPERPVAPAPALPVLEPVPLLQALLPV